MALSNVAAQVDALLAADFTAINAAIAALPAANAVAVIAAMRARVIDGTITGEQMDIALLALVGGDRTGIGTALERYMRQDGITPAMTFQPTDARGNGIAEINTTEVAQFVTDQSLLDSGATI